jgi:hypothetical protein
LLLIRERRKALVTKALDPRAKGEEKVLVVQKEKKLEKRAEQLAKTKEEPLQTEVEQVAVAKKQDLAEHLINHERIK